MTTKSTISSNFVLIAHHQSVCSRDYRYQQGLLGRSFRGLLRRRHGHCRRRALLLLSFAFRRRRTRARALGTLCLASRWGRCMPAVCRRPRTLGKAGFGSRICSWRLRAVRS